MSDDLLTVREVAMRLKVKVSWVYSHTEDLGAYRLGEYLRFSWGRALARLDRGPVISETKFTAPNEALASLEMRAPENGPVVVAGRGRR